MTATPAARLSATLAIAFVALMLIALVPPSLGSAASLAARAGTSSPVHGLTHAVTSPPPREWSCHGIKLLGTPACGGPANEFSHPLAGSSTPGWTQVNASPPAFAVYNFEMTYDASDGYVLLFGVVATGGGGQGPTQTWSYANGGWHQIYPLVTPQNCQGSSLAYDDSDGYVVYFAGPSCSSANQTWTYHGGVWTHLTPTLSPPGRYGASLTNDSADGYLVLFGGEGSLCGNYGWCNDTWTFSAGTWTQLSLTTHPSARAESGMAYDVADGYVLLFGGTGLTGNLNDTWNFSKGAWTQLHPAQSPPVPTPDAFSYNTADKEIVYTTAFNYTGNQYEITWTYQAGAWNPVSANGPLQRLGAGAADDPPGGQMLFFGGLGNVDLQDTWGLHAGAWTNLTPIAPTPRSAAAAAYDPAGHHVTLFGGISSASCCYYTNDTWAYVGGKWTQLSTPVAPSPRAQASLAYDTADGYLVLFGGYGPAGALNDTWEFTGGAWTQLTPSLSPPAGGYLGSMVYDGADGYVLLMGGPPSHVWTWTFKAGVWANVTKTAGTPPPGDSSNTLVYDSTDGYVLLFGTISTTFTNLTYTFRGGVWTNISSTVGTTPPTVAGAALVDFPPGGYVLLYEGTGTNDTWGFSNGTWTELFAPQGPSPRTGVASAYDAADSAGVFFGGSGVPVCGSGDLCGDTWVWTNSGPNIPFVRSFSATPDITDAGISSTLRVSAVGGMAPLTYAFAGLPPGCTSANQSQLVCSPASAGNFRIVVTVTDTLGNFTSAALTLQVNPALALASLGASPPTIVLGSTTDIVTRLVGGTSPFAYSYSGLPPGCPTQTVPDLPCVPTASGSFSIGVVVTDSVGGSTSGTTTLTVNSAGSGGAPSVSSFAASPSALVLGNATNFTVGASGGVGPLSYSYSGLPTGCSTANTSTLFCRPIVSGTFTVWVSVSDTTGASTSVATNVTVYPVGGGAGLTVTGFGATPSLLVVNTSTTLVVTATGGVGPIGYEYLGLPPGCLPANLSLLPCRPTATGNFSVHAVVFDSAGQRVGVITALEVAPESAGPAPTISSFFVSPSTATVQTNVSFVVSVSGGQLPLTYAYTGLPSGCSNVNAQVFHCAPTVAGNYTVQVRVTDALGRSTIASTPLTVLPAPTPQPGGGSLDLGILASPAVLAGLFAAGVAVVVALAALRRRRRSREEGRELVHAMETTAAEPPDDQAEV